MVQNCFFCIERKSCEGKQMRWALERFGQRPARIIFNLGVYVGFFATTPSSGNVNLSVSSLLSAQVAAWVHAYESLTSRPYELCGNKTLHELENCFFPSLHSTPSISSMQRASVWSIICKWLIAVVPLYLACSQQAGFKENSTGQDVNDKACSVNQREKATSPRVSLT